MKGQIFGEHYQIALGMYNQLGGTKGAEGSVFFTHHQNDNLHDCQDEEPFKHELLISSALSSHGT